MTIAGTHKVKKVQIAKNRKKSANKQNEAFFLHNPYLGQKLVEKMACLLNLKFQLGWKLYSNPFPTRYPTPNLDTWKASKRLLQNGTAHRGSTAHWDKFFSVNLHWRDAHGRRGAQG